jgi:hypothetical protein
VRGEHHAHVVVVQRGGPAGVLAVLRGQRLHRLGRQTREATDVAAVGAPSESAVRVAAMSDCQGVH